METSVKKEIEKLQDNLVVIRKIAGWTAKDLGDMIGVTKQTISNIETGRTQMSKTQYIAIRTMLDREIERNKENDALKKIVDILLHSNELTEDDQQKVEIATAYISGAVSKGISSQKIAMTVATMLGTALATLVVGPTWLDAITTLSKKKGKNDRA